MQICLFTLYFVGLWECKLLRINFIISLFSKTRVLKSILHLIYSNLLQSISQFEILSNQNIPCFEENIWKKLCNVDNCLFIWSCCCFLYCLLYDLRIWCSVYSWGIIKTFSSLFYAKSGLEMTISFFLWFFSKTTNKIWNIF